jgi:hypothetical protein
MKICETKKRSMRDAEFEQTPKNRQMILRQAHGNERLNSHHGKLCSQTHNRIYTIHEEMLISPK